LANALRRIFPKYWFNVQGKWLGISSVTEGMPKIYIGSIDLSDDAKQFIEMTDKKKDRIKARSVTL
jgi:hypothetical protein